jgi:hypothetical protein
MKVAEADKKVSEQLQNVAKGLNQLLEEIAGQKMGFSLVVFNAEAGSRLNYVSNCDRGEVEKALGELLAGWKKGMPDIKAHELDS